MQGTLTTRDREPTSRLLAKNLTISTYGATRFEIQGDVRVRRGFVKTIPVAVIDTLAEAREFVAKHAHGVEVSA